MLNNSKYQRVCVCVLSQSVMSDSLRPHGAHRAPLSMRFSMQEYWHGLSLPPPGDLSNPGIKPASSALAGEFFTTAPPRKPNYQRHANQNYNIRMYLTPIRMAILKIMLQIISSGEGMEKQEPSYIFGENVNWCSHCGEQYGGSLKN